MPNVDLILGADPGRKRSVRTEPTQRRSTQRLDALLDAAAEIVDETGFERLTTQMVAERAGASIGTVYRYVPENIRYYLGEEPILDNVPTYLPNDPEQLDHVLRNLDSLVVKQANESGGYGMLMGPTADEDELEDFRSRIIASPRDYIAQPVIPLSRHPTFVPDEQGE